MRALEEVPAALVLSDPFDPAIPGLTPLPRIVPTSSRLRVSVEINATDLARAVP
jgi:hypothetical protein